MRDGMSDVQIIEIEPSHWQIYRDVRLRSLQESPDAFCSTYELESKRTEEQWISRFDPNLGPIGYPLFAFLNSQVVGLAWGRIDKECPSLGHVFQMWVNPTARGKGIGRHLLMAILSWFRGQGVAKVELGVTCGNSNARKLYESLGFMAYGEPEQLRSGSKILFQSMVLELT